MGTWTEERRRFQRWIGLGALLSLGWGARGGLPWILSVERSPRAFPGSRAPAVWVCDRDGGALIGLTADGLRSARLDVPFPLELEAGSDGRLWLLRGVTAGPLAERRLASLAATGACRFDLPADGMRGLVACAGGAVAGVIEAPGEARVVRYDESGVRTDLGRVAPAAFLARGRAGELWCVEPDRLSRVLPTGNALRTLQSFRPPRSLVQLTWREQGGLALESRGSGELGLLELGASGRVESEVSCSALGLRSERAFLVGASEGRAWLVGERGEALLLEGVGAPRARASLPMLGVEAACRDVGGGLLTTSAGALMRLDESGARLPGQGGFRFACDLVRLSDP